MSRQQNVVAMFALSISCAKLVLMALEIIRLDYLIQILLLLQRVASLQQSEDKKIAHYCPEY